MAGLQSLLYLLCLGSVQAGKLLVIPADGSHWTGMKPLVEELGRRGNQMVVVIPEESLSLGSSEHTTMLTYPVPYTIAKMQELFLPYMDGILSTDTSADLGGLLGSFLTVEMLKTLLVRNAESLLFNKDLMKTLKDWDFDAILTDPFEPVGAIVGEFLNISSIYIQVNHPCGAHFLASQCPSPASYVPQRHSQYSDRMGFFRRTVNMVRALLQPLACRRMFSHADEIASRFLQRETSMMEIMSRAALWLMRFDFDWEFPRPVMPNMVMIGGFSVPKPKPLPQGLLNACSGRFFCWIFLKLIICIAATIYKSKPIPHDYSTLLLNKVQAGKLLVIPADGSHWTGMKPLVEELGRRGNQVVVVIPEESLSMGSSEHTTTLTYPVPYTKAEIQERMSSGMEGIVGRDTSTDPGGLLGSFLNVEMLKTLTVQNAESLLFNEELMKTLKDWDFDAILTDPFEPKGAIVGEFLSIPSIYLHINHPCGAHFLTSQCPSPASYVPQRYTEYSDRMSFFRRTVNMVRALLQPLACRRLFSHADEIASRFLRRETSMMEIMSRAALSLMRFDFDWEFPRPVMSNMVMIGGFSVTKPKPLPLVSLKN
ncbi:hypothetical protein AOLI_G00091330 [Acnodon oligacanthus]